MELDFAFIAEKAGTATDGKLFCFGGGFDAMIVTEPRFPIPVFPFSLVARFVIQPGEVGERHIFQVEMQNPKGELSPRSEPAYIAATKNQFDESVPVGSMMVANMQIIVENPGTYHFRVLLDGNVVKSIPLHIIITSADARLATVPAT